MEDSLAIERFHELSAQIENEVARVIVGQKDVLRQVLICILAGGHALLEGVPGLGKTMLVRTLGQVLDLKFSRIQFTPDLMPADITGTEILVDTDGKREFRFQPGPIFANLLMADEINRATPKTQSAMLEAMQEHSITVAEKTYQLVEPFFVLATQNPLEMEGTYPLPEAQLDRFLFKLKVSYPNSDELVEIMDRTTGSDSPKVEQVANSADILSMRRIVLGIPIASHIKAYIANLIIATHPESPQAPAMVRKYVHYGASPRGGQALILGAKVNALFAKRYNVAFEDVQCMALPALRHRLLLNFEGLAEGINPDTIIRELLEANHALR